MFITNTINRQIFDFTCPSEIVATKVQNEIAHNTGTSLNDIIDEVLTESLSGVELLIIDKLEIDLSDIKVEDFGNQEMSNSFRQKLQTKIASLVNVPPRSQNDHLLSIADACLDANIAFLTTGYFPWWVDGILEINADEMLQIIVRERPQVLKKFIIDNRNESAVMSRLQQQYKPSTKAAINTLIPDLFKKYNEKKIASEIDFFTTNIFEEAEPEIYLDELVTETLEKLCYVAEKPARLIKVHKVLALFHLLKEEPYNKWINKVKLLNIVSDEELHQLEQLGSYDNKKQTVYEDVVQILNKLDIFQLEFLLHQVAPAFNEEDTELEGEKVEAKKSRTSFLIDKSNLPPATKSFYSDNKEFLAESIDNSGELKNYMNIPATNNNIEYYNESIAPTENSFSKSRIDQSKEDKQVEENNVYNALPGFKQNFKKANGEIEGFTSRGDADFESLSSLTESRLRQDKTTIGGAEPTNQLSVKQEKKAGIVTDIENIKSFTNNTINTAKNPVNTSENEAFEGKFYLTTMLKNEAVASEKKQEKEGGFTNEEKLFDLKSDSISVGNNGATKTSATSGLEEENGRDAALQPGNESYLNQRQTNEEMFVDNNTNDTSYSFSKQPISDKNNHTISPVENPTVINKAKGTTKNKSEITKETNEILAAKSAITKESQKLSDNEKPGDLVDRSHRVEYILNRISRSSKALNEEIHSLNNQDLLILEKQFKQFEKLHNRNQILVGLIQHTYFFKYELLKILNAKYVSVNISEDNGNKQLISQKQPQKSNLSVLFDTLTATQTAFRRVIENLSRVEVIVLKDVLEKKAFDTESEKQVVKKILKKLPEEAINLLYFFTQLPENEMQQFVAKSARKTSVSTRQDDVPHSIYNYSSSNAGKLHIENAGLCIIATYFPALFGHLKYLEKGIFKNKAIATRALYLIQYLTSGKSRSPEYLLQFNKLLCGFQLEEDIHANVRLTKKEKMEADDLLQSVIENWSTLKNTSLNGFRASFLQRRGILTESEISWTLQVERKSYDMLLSSISWGYSIIKLAWMKKHIQVEW